MRTGVRLEGLLIQLQLMRRDWAEEMNGMNVNDTWSVLKQSLEEAIFKYVP